MSSISALGLYAWPGNFRRAWHNVEMTWKRGKPVSSQIGCGVYRDNVELVACFRVDRNGKIIQSSLVFVYVLSTSTDGVPPGQGPSRP
jgi:hypothetical protein